MGGISNVPGRIVLFPHGPAQTTKAQQSLTGLLIQCGADHARFMDTRFQPTRSETSQERYITYINRTHLNSSDLARSMIVFTKTNPPVMAIMQTRRQLTKSLPVLRTGIWIIFADQDENPFLLNNLDDPRLGELDDIESPAPIWRDAHDLEYLVLQRNCSFIEFTISRFMDLEQRIRNGFSQTEIDSRRFQAQAPPSSR